MRALGLTVCGLFLLLSATSNFMEARYVYVAPATGGDIGAQFLRTTGSGPRHVVVRELQPQSPLSTLGIRARNGELRELVEHNMRRA